MTGKLIGSANFYPRPPRGGRRASRCWKNKSRWHFYPRPLRGGRQKPLGDGILGVTFLSTPSARRATAATLTLKAQIAFLSTPSARRATVAQITPLTRLDISIHALCEEGDALRQLTKRKTERFLSTPSARRATARSSSGPTRSTYFYPRPLRGGRPTVQTPTSTFWSTFLSTPSARRATLRQCPHCK